MYKLVGTWSTPRPEDVEQFERHYTEVHGVLAGKVPGLRRLVLTRTTDGFAGASPAFYRVAEMLFDSPETMAASAESEEWRAMHADAGQMIERFGVTLAAAAGWEADRDQ